MPRTAREYLETEVNRLVAQAREVTRKAEEESRGLTDDERMKVEGLINETNHLKGRIAEQEENDRLLEAIENVSASPNGRPTVEDSPAKTLGEAFTKSTAYQALIKRGLVGSWTSGPIEFGQKLNDADGNRITAETGSPIFGSGTSNLQPQVLPGIQGPVEQRLTVADLLGQGQTTTNAIVFLKETLTVQGAISSTTSSAVLTSEGGLKPAAQLDFNKVTVAVDKIATFLPISDEMLEDQPQVASYINGRLQLFVRQAEEEYIVSKIAGVMGTGSSAVEVDGTNVFDGIAAAMMHVRVDAGLEPDGLLISPLDAAKMDVIRATGGTGNYFSGGPYGQANQNPWGLRRVVTTAVDNNSPIVGAFREGATLWRRGGLTIEASNSHADYFRRNLTALRCEERLAVTVFRNAAFQKVTHS
jgi:HK97 family phage major capsid protein